MRNRSNALLVELLIVILFFMLSSTTILEVFGKSHSMSSRAEAMADAVVQTQNVADSLYLSEDAEASLQALGFTQDEGKWSCESNGYVMEVVSDAHATESGKMHSYTVTALMDGEKLVQLPVKRFEEGSTR